MDFNSVRKGLFRFVAGFLTGLGLVIFGFSLVGLALYLKAIDEATWVQVLETLILLGLLLVTTHYARSAKLQAEASREMAIEARKQAETSAKAVVEMQEQRYENLRPVIASKHLMGPGTDHDYVIYWNEGVGPALNVRYWASFKSEGGKMAQVSDQLNFFGVYQLIPIRHGLDIELGDAERVPRKKLDVPNRVSEDKIETKAVYQDLYGNFFLSKGTLLLSAQPDEQPNLTIAKISEEEAKVILAEFGEMPAQKVKI